MTDDKEADRRQAFSLKYVEQTHAETMFAKQAVATFAQGAVRPLFLMNGGAVVAILAFLGSLYGKDGGRALLIAQTLSKTMPDVVLIYLVGLVLAVVTAAISYLNFSLMERITRSPEELIAWSRQAPMIEVSGTSMAWTARLGFAVGVGSLLCFCIGSWRALEAFRAVANL